MPSWPAESIRTGTPSLLAVVVPRMPAAKKEVCGPQGPKKQSNDVLLPIRIVSLSEAEPVLPIWILLLLPPVTFLAAW